MSQRLPIPGSDDGTWGNILNSFLAVSHANDGSLIAGSVGTVQLQDNAVNDAKLDSTTQTTLAAVAGKYIKPNTGIPASDLDAASQSNLTKAGTAVQLGGDIGGTATAPAVSKLQGHTLNGSSPSDGQVLTYSTTASAWVPGTATSTTVNDATTGSKGIVELAGDLGGTASSPTVTGTHLASALPVNQGGTGSATQNFVDLTASQTVGGTKTFSGTVSAANLQVTSGTPASGKVLTSDNSGVATWATPATGSSPNATQSAPGLVQLSGDLSGTATSPSVAKVNGIAVSGTPSSGQVLTASSSSAASWTTPVSGGAQALAPTAVQTSAYTAAAGDFIPVDATGGSVSLTLPTAPADKTRVEIKLINTSGTNNVTIASGGSDVFNRAGGATSVTLSLVNQAVMLQYAATGAIWYVQSDDLPLSSLVSGLSRTITSTYTVASSDHVILADATSAAFTITLPTAIGFTGRFTIDAITATTNMVTLATSSSQTIDGASTTTLGTQNSGATWSSVDLISDGANWRTV